MDERSRARSTGALRSNRAFPWSLLSPDYTPASSTRPPPALRSRYALAFGQQKDCAGPSIPVRGTTSSPPSLQATGSPSIARTLRQSPTSWSQRKRVRGSGPFLDHHLKARPPTPLCASSVDIIFRLLPAFMPRGLNLRHLVPQFSYLHLLPYNSLRPCPLQSITLHRASLLPRHPCPPHRSMLEKGLLSGRLLPWLHHPRRRPPR